MADKADWASLMVCSNTIRSMVDLRSASAVFASALTEQCRIVRSQVVAGGL